VTADLGGVFDGGDRVPQILAERIPGQGIRPHMPHAVARHLVSRRRAAHKRGRQLRGILAQDEECGGSPELLQQIKKCMHRGGQLRVRARAAPTRFASAKGSFDVDGQQVGLTTDN
jgi:hypothetical protein